MILKTNKKIQEVYNSQIINPIDMVHLLESVFRIKFNVSNNSTGLLSMFDHARLKPLVASYDFSKGKVKNTVLLGKGVLYDVGGYNLKSDASEMFGDKYGALTAITLASALKLPVKVFFAVNLISDLAVLPGTILKSTNDKKVQIIDTDAEGRIGLAHLIEDTSATNLITFATLTGHSVYSVGSGHAEVFSKNHNLLSKIIKNKFKVVGVGRYFDDYKKVLYKDKVLQNLNKGYREAGAGKAYAFLNEFLNPRQELTHFDIAGLMGNQDKCHTFGLNEVADTIKLIMNTKN